MTKTKRVLIALFAFLGLSFGGLQLAPAVYADASTDAAKKSSCEGIGGTYKDGECTTDSASLDDIIARVVNLISVLVSIVAVIMIMVGGFKYSTAAGDTSKVSSAKSTILYAIIGLVVVALAQFIVKFVIDKSTT